MLLRSVDEVLQPPHAHVHVGVDVHPQIALTPPPRDDYGRSRAQRHARVPPSRRAPWRRRWPRRRFPCATTRRWRTRCASIPGGLRQVQWLALTYRHTPFRGDYRGTQLDAQAALFFPGLAPHHSLEFAGGLEGQKPGDYRFASALTFPRGYAYRFDERSAAGSASYALPLAYPDLVLGRVAYVKRLRGLAFFDCGAGHSAGLDRLYRSYGAELIADTDILLLPLDLGVGVRLVHRIDARDNRVEAVLSTGGS